VALYALMQAREVSFEWMNFQNFDDSQHFQNSDTLSRLLQGFSHFQGLSPLQQNQ